MFQFSYLFDKFIEKDGNKIDVKVRGGNWKIVWWFLRHIFCVEKKKKLAEIKKRQRGKAAHMNIKQEADSFKISANIPLYV